MKLQMVEMHFNMAINNFLTKESLTKPKLSYFKFFNKLKKILMVDVIKIFTINFFGDWWEGLLVQNQASDDIFFRACTLY